MEENLRVPIISLTFEKMMMTGGYYSIPTIERRDKSERDEITWKLRNYLLWRYTRKLLTLVKECLGNSEGYSKLKQQASIVKHKRLL
ncbi:hypothetical protein V1477_011713 [Vespula maculifrons]|uniref:Uncharacterized protein n=1 Tax=Vespula maculifrons TaxID=7453 RepID=A0ABD2BZZ8_VESMC